MLYNTHKVHDSSIDQSTRYQSDRNGNISWQGYDYCFDVIFNEQNLDRRTAWTRFGPIKLKCRL